jgi:hypothetical protein
LIQTSLSNGWKVGVSEAAIERTIIIEFGSKASAFSGFVPEGYMLEDGTYATILDLGRDFI